ncbi:sulfatase-like hydrolase/transferase [Thermopirellula anaerolimosa]
MQFAKVTAYAVLFCFVLTCCMFFGRASISAAADESPAPSRPNIILMVSDELGYYELSCMGHPHFRTPHIDRLAAEGIRFTQALAGSSLCAPTRCCLMTGKHSGHTSVRTNGGGTPMRPDEATIASVLKQVGYATGGFGKWGCGGRGSTGVPELHGFDVFFGYYDQVHAHSYYTPYLIRNSVEVPLPGNHGLSRGATYSHYVIMEEAEKFIRENKDRPFFCYLPITPPHGIHDIPESDPAWQPYKDEPWPDDARKYAAMVNMVDRNVGEIRDLLRELGLEQKTIIFFSGDNGGAEYFKDAEHPRGFHAPNVDPRTGVQFRGGKGNLYEGGLRVPMIACWPGRIPPGRVSHLVCYFPDILPTLAELAGAVPPPDIDGISLVPETLGAEAAGREQPQHEFLYWELAGQIAVRKGDWKAVRPARTGPWELYDLSQDVGETRDLAGKHPEILEELIALAESAHQPAVEGSFTQPELNEKDRRAKFGDAVPPDRVNVTLVQRMPEEGLIPRKNYRIVSVDSESEFNNHLARHAIDGNPLTWWHTQFSPELKRPPHQLLIDLGDIHTVRGVRYLARQDTSWNGAVSECDVTISESLDFPDEPTARLQFSKTKEPQDAPVPPTRGRYVRFRIDSEVNGGPWASIAEIGFVGE